MFIYSEKATKCCEIFTLLLTTVHTLKNKRMLKFCGLLRIYELYEKCLIYIKIVIKKNNNKLAELNLYLGK